MTLCETGTRALLGAVFGTTAESELGRARKLLHRLDSSMLVLMERGFDAGELPPSADPEVLASIFIGSFYARYLATSDLPEDWAERTLSPVWPDRLQQLEPLSHTEPEPPR
jgi:hypothetical protein